MAEAVAVGEDGDWVWDGAGDLEVGGLAESGGAARMMISEGMVQVDGRDESRKTAKIRAGQVVSLQGARIRVLAAPPQD